MEELKPCLCGQEQNERQMLVVECCDSDGYYIKCDSCGACGPVGYPDEEYDACDYAAYDKANEEAKAKAISLWNDLWKGREALRAELRRVKTERDVATEVVENIQGKVAMYAGKYEMEKKAREKAEDELARKDAMIEALEELLPWSVVNTVRARLAEIRGERNAS